MSINTFVNTSIHSIEKQFSLNSKQTGFIAASNEITSLLFVPFVSFYGGYSHKARLLGYGSLVTGLGCFAFILPRFLIGAYDPAGGKWADVWHGAYSHIVLKVTVHPELCFIRLSDRSSLNMRQLLITNNNLFGTPCSTFRKKDCQIWININNRLAPAV